MTFYNESWFWTPCFVALTSLFTALASLGAMHLGERNKIRIERLRLHEDTLFTAYKSLYSFISSVQMMLWPPDNVRVDFCELMRREYFVSVKPGMLFYPAEIRGILKQFEAQYDCLHNPDLRPSPTFDEFINGHLFRHLHRMEKAVEKRTDGILSWR